jgi:hypothetical protein
MSFAICTCNCYDVFYDMYFYDRFFYDIYFCGTYLFPLLTQQRKEHPDELRVGHDSLVKQTTWLAQVTVHHHIQHITKHAERALQVSKRQRPTFVRGGR